jgi:MoaA/NifB/PqqE/SkfB family radical SAM enzyme
MIITDDTPLVNPQCHISNRVYSIPELIELFGGRDIYIWGAGQKGRPFLMALERNGFTVTAFLDSSEHLIGSKFRGISIIDPKILFSDNIKIKDSFIILASIGDRMKEMLRACEELGLKYKAQYIKMQDLSPFFPSIDISGVCNLKCIACPMGDKRHRPPAGNFMSLDNYKKVLNKLIKDIPLLYYVDLFIWSDPLIHPLLPEFIRINTELGIGTGISTNFNCGKYLEDIIKAAPAYIRVSVSGYGPKNYELTHTGGRWKDLYANLAAASKYIKKYNVETVIIIYFHANKNNLSEFGSIYNLCKELGLRLDTAMSMVFPTYAMDYLENGELGGGGGMAKDIMLLSLDEVIRKCKMEHSMTCFMRRGIPNINWDMSVLTCCNYPNDIIAPNYLDISLDEIIDLRNKSDLCKKCIKYSLHRYWQPDDYSYFIKPLLSEINKVPAQI